jgi:hypothetical protein
MSFQVFASEHIKKILWIYRKQCQTFPTTYLAECWLEKTLASWCQLKLKYEFRWTAQLWVERDLIILKSVPGNWGFTWFFKVSTWKLRLDLRIVKAVPGNWGFAWFFKVSTWKLRLDLRIVKAVPGNWGFTWFFKVSTWKLRLDLRIIKALPRNWGFTCF